MSAMTGLPPEMKDALAKSWKLLLTAGIISAVLGVIAIIVPPLASVTITLLVGILLLIGAVAYVAEAISRGTTGHRIWSFIVAIIYVVAGVWLIVNPVSGTITAGRMAVTTPLLTISIVTDDLTLDLNIRNAQVRGTFGPMGNGIVNGAIGGSLRVSDIAMAAESIMPGLSATVMSVLGGIADKEPQAADPTTCDSLSVGIAFDGVNAANAPGTASGT